MIDGYRFLIAYDSSGSMTEDELRYAIEEMKKLNRYCFMLFEEKMHSITNPVLSDKQKSERSFEAFGNNPLLTGEKMTKEQKKRLQVIKLREGSLKILDGVAYTAFWGTGYGEIKRKCSDRGIMLSRLINVGSKYWAAVLSRCTYGDECAGQGDVQCDTVNRTFRACSS